MFFNSLKSKFILTKNTKRRYFKNTFELNKYWDSKRGFIISTDREINQDVSNPFKSFSNKLKWIQPFGKKLITIKSVVTYTNAPQKLTVTLGQFEELLNNKKPFDKINQSINASNFYTNNSVSFTKGYRGFTFNPKIGFTLQNQKLNSYITLFEDNNITRLTGNFRNNLSFNKSSFYTDIKTNYRYKNWKIELETPLKIQIFDRVDNNLNKAQKLNRLLFEPRFSVRKDINAFFKTTFSASLKNSFGDVNQLYYGYILNNYRNIQQYDTPILESFRKSVSLSFSYRNPIKSIFINTFYSYGNTKQNLLLVNLITVDGASSLGFVERDNSSNTHNINLRGSKYFSALETTLTITANTSLNKKKHLLNGILTDVTTKNIQLNTKLNTEITEWMSVDYKNKFSISNTQFKDKSLDNIITEEHLLNLNFYPASNQYIGFDAEYYRNNFSNKNKENYFLNMNYRYTLKKSKIDLELNLNNILNTKQFTTVYNNSFSYIQSTYNLRPSQLIIKVKFNF